MLGAQCRHVSTAFPMMENAKETNELEPTKVTAKLQIIPSFLPKTNSFRIYPYRIRRVTDTATDIAHYIHSKTKSKDPALHVKLRRLEGAFRDK
jgi:hypothetical protein